MFLEFSVENYRSIADRQTLSFVASKHRSSAAGKPAVEDPAFSASQVLTSAVIYGANASGKSNILRALNTMIALIATVGHSPERWLEPFRLDQEWVHRPTRFELSFLKDGIRYQYGFALDKKRVHEEWLVAYPKKLPQVWFKRVAGAEPEVQFGPHLRGEKTRIASMTRPDALFMSVAAQFNHAQLSDIHEWLVRNVVAQRSQGFSPMGTIKLLQGESAAAINELVRGADLGITGFTVHRHAKVPEPTSGPRMVLREEKDDEYWEVLAEHRAADGSPVLLDLLDSESEGTIRYFTLVEPLLRTLAEGGLLAVDELDQSLHPLLVRRIVSLFHDPAVNTHRAQLVFNTHDTTLLDPELFRRDQIWFVEKTSAGKTHLYSLLDYSPRKDEALQRGYLLGRYGGIPFLGGFQFPANAAMSASARRGRHGTT